MKKKVVASPLSASGGYYINYLWTDKKRHFGLPISFTKYSLSTDRVFEEKGLLISKHNEILLYRIRDISVTVSLWQRLFGVGTIRIYSADSSTPVLYMINIKNPLDVKELMHITVERVKEEKGVYFGEYVSASM